MKVVSCEICGKRDATITQLMVIRRSYRAVRTCEPQCASFVEDVAAIIPTIDTYFVSPRSADCKTAI